MEAVIEIILPPPGVSWVSKDHKLSVKYKYIGFVLNFIVISEKMTQICIFYVFLCHFSLFLEVFF